MYYQMRQLQDMGVMDDDLEDYGDEGSYGAEVDNEMAYGSQVDDEEDIGVQSDGDDDDDR